MKKQLIKLFAQEYKREWILGDRVYNSKNGYEQKILGKVLKVKLFFGVWVEYSRVKYRSGVEYVGGYDPIEQK